MAAWALPSTGCLRTTGPHRPVSADENSHRSPRLRSGWEGWCWSSLDSRSAGTGSRRIIKHWVGKRTRHRHPVDLRVAERRCNNGVVAVEDTDPSPVVAIQMCRSGALRRV